MLAVLPIFYGLGLGSGRLLQQYLLILCHGCLCFHLSQSLPDFTDLIAMDEVNPPYADSLSMALTRP